jgi:hypothetical protein
MIPQFYHSCLNNYLSESQQLTLEILLWLLQVHKQVKIERLAALFPVPILYESRRRHIQRFLVLPNLSLPLIWFPLIKYILRTQIPYSSRVILAVDRTQWGSNNLLMVAVIWKKRAFPVYWQFLDKAGSSNTSEQIAVIRPVLKLFSRYEIVVIGDREFRSVELAYWLKTKKVFFALRLKKDTYVRPSGGSYKRLIDLGLAPGMKLFDSEVNYTKKKGFGTFCLAAYWKRKYRGSSEKEGWYILTNLNAIDDVIQVYKARSGIEALFKDCKTGGYNLEGTKASTERLNRLVLLIAMAYTLSSLKGNKTRCSNQEKYVCRLKEVTRIQRRHSNFWIGLYGLTWIIGWDFCRIIVEKLMEINRSKLPYFQQGLKAMSLISIFA